MYLKGKSTTFHVDVQSMLMVIVVNLSNNSSVCAILTEKAEFSELSCLHSCSCSAYMYQDAWHHKKIVLAGSQRSLSVTTEHFSFFDIV